jgi:hypothetical protein
LDWGARASRPAAAGASRQNELVQGAGCVEKFAKFSLPRYRVVAKVEEAFLPLFIKIKEPGRLFYLCCAEL